MADKGADKEQEGAASAAADWAAMAQRAMRLTWGPLLGAQAHTAAYWAAAADGARTFMEAHQRLTDVLVGALRRQQDALRVGAPEVQAANPPAGEAAAEPAENAAARAAHKPYLVLPLQGGPAPDAALTSLEAHWRAYTRELESVARSLSPER